MRRRAILGLSVLAAIVGATVVAQMPAAERPKERIFTLRTVDGAPFGSADLVGRPYLVFFGFTHCPDVCPTALFELSGLLKEIGPAADRITPLFVSIDPERDTADLLKLYMTDRKSVV